jgi:hypothetical protein
MDAMIEQLAKYAVGLRPGHGCGAGDGVEARAAHRYWRVAEAVPLQRLKLSPRKKTKKILNHEGRKEHQGKHELL